VVILVEGRSDRAALEVLAPGAAIVVLDGITNLPRWLGQVTDDDVRVLVDRNEAPYAARHLGDRGRLFVCVADLEDELRRALGVDATLGIIEAAGELRSFRTLQQQPAQRDWTVEQVLRRFMGSKSGRKAKYGRLLAEALVPDRIPMPLAAVLRPTL
jgi:hypothetical protein